MPNQPTGKKKADTQVCFFWGLLFLGGQVRTLNL